MTHSTTYPFRRWYRRPLTVRESAVIGLLERRRRRRTGCISIVISVSAAEHAAISRLLLHYALFLNNRCTLHCIIRIATTGATTVVDRLTSNSTLLTSHCAVHGATRSATPHCAAARRRIHPARAGPNSSLLTARSATNS